MNRLIKTTLATIVATGIGLAGAGAASAASDPVPNPPVPSAPGAPADTTGTTKARCDAAIDRRVADLATWTVKVDGLQHLSADQKAALDAEMAAVSNGLTTVAKPAVDNAADKKALRAACQAIVLDYRVYRVVHPQVFITAAADSELAAITTLQQYAAELKAKGADTSQVDALLASAQGTASAIPGAVAAITPASYNSDPAGTSAVIAGARKDLGTVKSEIRQARTMLRQLAKAVKA